MRGWRREASCLPKMPSALFCSQTVSNCSVFTLNYRFCHPHSLQVFISIAARVNLQLLGDSWCHLQQVSSGACQQQLPVCRNCGALTFSWVSETGKLLFWLHCWSSVEIMWKNKFRENGSFWMRDWAGAWVGKGWERVLIRKTHSLELRLRRTNELLCELVM